MLKQNKTPPKPSSPFGWKSTRGQAKALPNQARKAGSVQLHEVLDFRCPIPQPWRSNHPPPPGSSAQMLLNPQVMRGEHTTAFSYSPMHRGLMIEQIGRSTRPLLAVWLIENGQLMHPGDGGRLERLTDSEAERKLSIIGKPIAHLRAKREKMQAHGLTLEYLWAQVAARLLIPQAGDAWRELPELLSYGSVGSDCPLSWLEVPLHDPKVQQRLGRDAMAAAWTFQQGQRQQLCIAEAQQEMLGNVIHGLLTGQLPSSRRKA